MYPADSGRSEYSFTATEAVALAMGYSVAKEEWTRRRFYVAAVTYTEIEETILRLEKEWLAVENAAMFRREELDYMTLKARTRKRADTAKVLLGAVRGTS